MIYNGGQLAVSLISKWLQRSPTMESPPTDNPVAVSSWLWLLTPCPIRLGLSQVRYFTTIRPVKVILAA